MALLAPIKTHGNAALARQGGGPLSDGTSLLGSTLESIDLRNLWRIMWRWRGLILWVTVVLTALAIFVIYQLTPLYTGQAQVLVGIQQLKIGNLEQALGAIRPEGEMVATEIGIIRSRKLAENTVAKLSLDNDPEFNPALQPAGMISRFFRWQHFIPQSWLPKKLTDDQEAGDTDRNMTKIIDTFESKLKVTNDGKSRIITIAFQSESPVTAAQVANTLADAYIVEELDAKFEATKRANIWLADRLNTLRQEVTVSEDAVEKYRAANGLLRTNKPQNPGGADTTLTSQQMAQVSAEAITAHTKYLEAQSRLAQLQRSGVTRGGRNVDDAIKDDNLMEVLQSPIIQNLKQQEADAQRRAADLASQYGDKHPKMISVRGEIAEIRTKIQTEVGRI